MPFQIAGRSTPKCCTDGIFNEETIGMVRRLIANNVLSLMLGTAAYTMYYRARKLDDHLFTGMRDTSHTDQLLGLQLDAYIVAIGALSMLDSKEAWISVQVASVSREGISARQVLDIFPPETLKEGLPNVEIVNLADMRKEFILCKSRRQLARRDYPDGKQHTVFWSTVVAYGRLTLT